MFENLLGIIMFDNVNDIANFYNNCPEKEHSRLERHQLEYDLTWCYLNKYLPPQGKYSGNWSRHGEIHPGAGQARLSGHCS